MIMKNKNKIKIVRNIEKTRKMNIFLFILAAFLTFFLFVLYIQYHPQHNSQLLSWGCISPMILWLIYYFQQKQ